MTPTERLARAMGYETRTESPGYGNTVVRVKVRSVLEFYQWEVFDPRKKLWQFADVLAWLISNDARFGQQAIFSSSWDTGEALVREVVDAAEKLAQLLTEPAPR